MTPETMAAAVRARAQRARGQRGRAGQRGQSVVEFTIVLPVLLMVLIAIGDLARVYASMITLESAAREAADWGANGFGPYGASGKWAPTEVGTTVAQMERRACTPALNLPDFAPAGGDGSICSNPSFACTLADPDNGVSGPCAAVATCYDPTGLRTLPCTLEVTLTYDFKLMFPPSTITFVRDSTFNVSYR